MLTVAQLAREFDLALLAGDDTSPRAIRSVHVSELADPTRWLSGGELLLTTGMSLGDITEQREFVRRLVEHDLAGLGFGTGFGFDAVPAAIVEEAREHGFPLFEVPYEMPFIAITERAFDSLVNEQYELLQRAVAIQRSVERLIVEEQDLGSVVRALADALGATLLVLDGDGEVLASHGSHRGVSGAALTAIRREAAVAAAPSGFVPSQLEGEAIALPIPQGSGGSQGTQWLVALGERGRFPDFERFIAQHAVMVVALALMRERVVAATERRLAGDVLSAALDGSVGAAELRARLAPFGLTEDCLVFVLDAGEDAGAQERLERELRMLGVRGLVGTVPTARREVLCAVFDPGPRDVVELADVLRAAVGEGTRAAVSRVASVEALRRSFHEARCALEVGVLANGDGPGVAGADDLGAYRLLLSLQDDDGLRIFCDDLLSPIEQSRGGNGAELMRSLETYLEHNGSWESAARALYCHRHTLRYRISRIEELTGRNLDVAQHRIEFWLALRGREMLA